MIIDQRFQSLLLVFSFLCMSETSDAQSNSWQIEGKSISELRTIPVFQSSSYFLFSSFLKEEKASPALLINPSSHAKAYNFQHLGIFCKLEVKMEKSAKFPIKVRLGEVQYTEALEGKNYALPIPKRRE